MPLPRVTITPKTLKRVRNHDCWVFRDEVTPCEPGIASGELVEVTDPYGAFVAYAFYNERSHIALRILSLAKDQPLDDRWLGERLARAIARRHPSAHTNARRLVFSEADGLPGLIVDQYADYLVVQFRSAGMDHLRSQIVDLLGTLVHPTGILERSDKEFRQEEGLVPLNQILVGTVPARILIEEDGLRFLVDPHRGLKTGFFLDQRPTRQKLRERVTAKQTVLDAFSYTGSLGIVAASRGAGVVCVEQREEFLELAKENARLNGVADRMEFIAGNAFYWLEAKAAAGARYDWVLLDPPALAKSKADVISGRQALHHLLVQALGLLDCGGLVALSICTYHLLSIIEEIVRIAAAQHGVPIRIRDHWLQAEDHPWVLQFAPSRYLASWLLERDAQSGASSTTPPRSTAA